MLKKILNNGEGTPTQATVEEKSKNNEDLSETTTDNSVPDNNEPE